MDYFPKKLYGPSMFFSHRAHLCHVFKQCRQHAAIQYLPTLWQAVELIRSLALQDKHSLICHFHSLDRLVRVTTEITKSVVCLRCLCWRNLNALPPVLKVNCHQSAGIVQSCGTRRKESYASKWISGNESKYFSFPHTGVWTNMWKISICVQFLI